jgi:murein DD-endopeptidase MepM/ murein hydrolase activator NlpD
MIMKTLILLFLSGLFVCTCKSDVDDPGGNHLISVEANFMLPYPVGVAHPCSQGFNSSFSHYGSFRYSVDFDMPVGTIVTAARDGVVVYAVENYTDTDHSIGHENVVIIKHEDATYSRYVHLTRNGALVSENQALMVGDTVALSGNSGNSNHPHLHFDVTRTFTGRDDQTIPFDFINMEPHPVGFEKGAVYEAMPF